MNLLVSLGSALLSMLALLPAISHGYNMFQERLPNGIFVPHPCKPNYLWKGVGHEAIGGGGARNPFGLDFAANGFKWDRCLCLQDSDGDGLTNGQELGDPDCEWAPGDAPRHKFGLSHPGICEPLDDPECQRINTFDIECEPPEEFTCEAINSPDVRNITLRYPPTQVPAQETTYICMTFDLPDDEEYHLVAYEPIIDNEDVMHHIVLYGCVDNEEESVAAMDAPATCDMAMDGCSEILALWGVGAGGTCLNEQAGFRVGKNGYNVVNMQLHWTNPAESTKYMDSSGMILYYTPVLRKNDATVLQTSQNYLQIPPGKKRVDVDGTCSSECTSQMPEPVYITNAILHMHYQGSAGYGELWRSGQKVQDIIKTDDYDYDTPDIINFETPIEMQPGDEVRVRCTFNSLNQDKITFWGDGSYDEMCIVFLTYYPANPYFTMCGQIITQDMCSLNRQPGNDTELDFRGGMNEDGSGTDEGENGQEWCDFEKFSNDPVVFYHFEQLGKSCDPKGASCYPGCKEKIDILRKNPCMKGMNGIAVESALAGYGPMYAPLRLMMHSCDTYDNLGNDNSDHNHDDDDNRTGGDRYDPQANNLPVGGVCPFGEVDIGDGATDSGDRVQGGIGLSLLMLASMLVALLS